MPILIDRIVDQHQIERMPGHRLEGACPASHLRRASISGVASMRGWAARRRFFRVLIGLSS
ncbi:MAG: hypothetical protein WAN51_00075 [Alphaproteobacteria bacterium]